MRWLAIVAAGVLSAGCASVGKLSGDVKFDPSRESVVVLGLQPDNYRINLFPGSVKNGRYSQRQLYMASFLGVADQGYVVAKVRPDMPMAIANIRVVEDPKDLVSGQDLSPCGGAITLVFTVPRGKVVYLADLEYRPVRRDVEIGYAADLERARRHVDEKFPALRGRLEQGEFSLLPTSMSCTTTIFIPVPASR